MTDAADGRSGKEFVLYLLRCADGSLYTGIAKDVRRRIEAHAGGHRGAKYLRGRLPVELVFARPAGTRAEATRLEYRVKRLTRRDKEALIRGQLSFQELLSRCPTEHQGDSA